MRKEAPETATTIPQTIRHTYRQITGRPGQLVSLATLRGTLDPSLTRDQVDAGLMALLRDRDVQIIPSPRPGHADHAAGLWAGNRWRHTIAIGVL